MKWEFSTSYQGLGSKSPTVQRWLKQKGSRVIIEFDKVLSHSIILPPRLSKIILVNAHRASRQKYLEICQRLTYGLGFPSAMLGPSRKPRLGKSMVKYGAIWCNIVKLSTVQPCTSTVHEYLRTRGPVQSSVLHQEHSEAEGKDRDIQQLPEADLFGICSVHHTGYSAQSNLSSTDSMLYICQTICK